MANSVRALDLFCGAGGSSCGLRMAGVKPVCGIDLWPLATTTYKANYPGAAVLTADIRMLKPADARKKVGNVDLIVASPECTNHSPAKGKARRCEKSRLTAFEVVRFAAALQPRWIVVENVVSMERWHRFAAWLRSIQRLGYHTQIAKLSAADFGVPQTRRRLFVLCDCEREPTLPLPDTAPGPTIGSVLKGMNGLSRLWPTKPLFGLGRAHGTIARARRAIRKLGKRASFALVYYGSDGPGGWQPLDRPLRTVTTRDRFALVRPDKTGHQMRMLQPPELAAAMGFPPDYKWPECTRREKIKLIGNAVCPPVMCRVVQGLIARR